MVDSWKIIPKHRPAYIVLTLVASNYKTKHGYILKIPLRLRKQSEYFKNAKLIHANLLEKENLLMIQFVPKEQAKKDTHTIYYGSLKISKDIINCDITGKKRREIEHYLGNHNIIIDRKQFKRDH